MYRDRAHAGERLLERLLERFAGLAQADVLVEGLYAGGVIVGREIARGIGAQLDVSVTLRMGAPGYDDLNIGGVATGGVAILDSRTIGMLGVPDSYIRAVGDAAALEVARLEARVRGTMAPISAAGRTVLLVDDGAHARWRVRAATRAARQAGAAKVVFAVPVASSDALQSIAEEADDVICDHVPECYCGASACYADFEVPTLDRVRMELTRARFTQPRPVTRTDFGSFIQS